MTPASSNACNDNINMNQGDELDTFLDAQDLILNENQKDCEMEPSTSSASPSFDCSSYSHSSSSSASNHASSPQSSTNFNSNSSEMEEEIRTPPLDFMDSINQFDSIGNSTSNQHHLSFDFDFSVPQSPNPKISNSNHQINQVQFKSFHPQFSSNGKSEEQQPDWSDPATLTNLWPSPFNDAINNNQAHDSIHQSSNGIGNGNNDQWVFSAQLPISTIDPSTVASSSSSCSDSSSASDNGGAMQVTSNPTSTSTSAHNSPPPSIKAQLSESTGPVEKKRKVSSSGAAQSSPQTKSTPATTKKGASTRTNNKRKQSNGTSNPEPKEEKEETPPPVSTRPLPQVDTSVSHSSLFVHPDVSGLSKRDARLVKNRAAAFLSRQRKREEFGELEKKSKALEGACRAIWKSLVKLREEAKGEGKSRVDELIRIYLDQEEKLKQEEDEKMEKDENVNVSSKGVREVLNEVVGGLNLDENQMKGKEDEKEKEKKSSNGKGNKRGNKRSRDSTSLEASPAAPASASPSSSITIGSSPPLTSNVNEEIQSLRSELNNSKIQNSALLQQLAIERSKVQNLPISIPSNGFVEPQAQIKLEDLEEETQGKGLEGMNLDFDYNFSGAFSSKPSQPSEPEFSYPTSTPIVPSQNPIPEENLSNSNPNNDQKPISSMKKRSHNLSLAPAFTPSSIGNGPSSPFSLSIPGSPLLHSGFNSSMHGHAHGNGDRNQEDQKTRKTAGGMALMVILFSFALWGMPAGSGRDGGMARLNGQQGSSDGRFDLGRVLNPPSQFNNPSKSKKSTPSSHLSPKDLDLSSEDDSSFSLLIPKNPTSEQRLPSCSITDVSHESARLLPVCRIEGGSSESSNVVTPVLSRSGSEKKKVDYLNSSTQTQDESTKSSSRSALAYHTDSNNYLLDSTLKKSNGRQREGIENESWLTQVLPSNLDNNLSDLRSELLDFSGWLSGLGSKSQSEDSSSSTSVYKDFGSNLSDKEKNLVREEFGNYLESRLEMSRERGFILVGPPASSELSRRLGGNSKKSKSTSNDSEDETMIGDQKTIQADENHQDEEQASCPSIPTKLTLFVPAPKNFKPQECPVSSRHGKSSSSSSSSSGGLSGLGTKALSLRPDTSVTMSRDLGDGLKVTPPKKLESGKKEEAQFSSSTEAVLRALGLSQCPSLDHHQQQSTTSFDSMLDSVGLNSELNDHGNDGESFLELQFSLSGAKVRNKNQLADAVVGAIQRS